jgi:hypothetical protein
VSQTGTTLQLEHENRRAMPSCFDHLQGQQTAQQTAQHHAPRGPPRYAIRQPCLQLQLLGPECHPGCPGHLQGAAAVQGDATALRRVDASQQA